MVVNIDMLERELIVRKNDYKTKIGINPLDLEGWGGERVLSPLGRREPEPHPKKKEKQYKV